MRQPKTKTFAILMNGVERFQLQAFGQINAIHKALEDARYHAICNLQPDKCFLVSAVEVPSTNGEVTS